MGLNRASHTVQQRLLDTRLASSGHWTGELSASALSTATAISALSFYLDHPDSDSDLFPPIARQVKHGLAWLQEQQNSDGGFGDTSRNYSNISTTMLVVAALHAAGRVEPCHDLLNRAQEYIDQQGGIEGLRSRYGKDKTFAVPILANCAMAGLVDWKEVSALPFEAACVPQRFYHLLQLPVVSYAIPALVAIGQVKYFSNPPWDPVRRTIRRLAVEPSLKVLQRMQPASGGYLEAVPLTSFVAMALIKSDRPNHPVVKKAIQFLIDSFRVEETERGSWPIDTNLATWSTTLTINAFGNDRNRLTKLIESEPQRWNECLDWLLRCQHRKVHPFTGSPPGGWGWTDLSGAVPDADDSPGALLALRHLLDTGQFEDRREQIREAASMGISWLLKLQNRDRGWPTFCRGWGKLPFDRSGSDLTAHVIRGLLAWESELAHTPRGNFSWQQVTRAVERGFGYLARQQNPDGSWLPLWFGNQDQPDDINPFYGTAKVLAAYRDAKRFDTQPAQFGLDWLVRHQNPDGGWGGGPSVQWDDPSLGNSSVEETALCTEVLLDANLESQRQAASRGIAWLVRATEQNSIDQCSPIGFYFAKLWYYEKSYPLIFAASALVRANRDQKQTTIE